MTTTLLTLWLLAGCGTDAPDDNLDSGATDPQTVESGMLIAGSRLGELAGVSVGGGFDFDGDGHDDVAVGAMLSDSSLDASGRACLFLGPLTADVALKNSPACYRGGSDNELFGRDVEGLGDLDGDGLDELGLGAVHQDDGGANAGAVSVVWGDPNPSEAQWSVIDGAHPGGHLGLDIAPLPGSPTHIAVGAHETILDGAHSDELRGEGVAWVSTVPHRGERTTIDVLGVGYSGERFDDRAGVSVSSAGDLNGDGLMDLLVGASQARSADDGPQVGAVYTVLAPFDAGGSLADADGKVLGTLSLGWFGWSTTGLGDVDGDGLDDFASGAFKDGTNGVDAGAVYVFTGTVDWGRDLDDASATLLGEWAGDKAGEVVDRGGDYDGDGVDELLISAPTAGHLATWGGAVYVVRAPFSGVRTLGAQDDIWTGTQDLQFVGSSLAAAGDANGDGHPDLLVGAMGQDTNKGAAYLLTEVGW